VFSAIVAEFVEDALGDVALGAVERLEDDGVTVLDGTACDSDVAPVDQLG
jgi:hypothetical protein